jgi:hypothetical protein
VEADQRRQCLGHHRRGRPVLGLFGQRLQAEFGDPHRHARQRRHRLRVGVEVRAQRLGRVPRRPGQAAGQGAVEQQAEGVDVGGG